MDTTLTSLAMHAWNDAQEFTRIRTCGAVPCAVPDGPGAPSCADWLGFSPATDTEV